MYSKRKEEPELLDPPEDGGDPFGPEKEITLEDHEKTVNGGRLRWYHWFCIVIWLVTAGVLGYVIPTYLLNGRLNSRPSDDDDNDKVYFCRLT